MYRGNPREHLELVGDQYNIEASALHRKLQSKNEAVKIMRQELERFRTERDQFKLMAETLQLRFTAIRRNTDYSNVGFNGNEVATLLNETREKNIKLTTENEALKQKLVEVQGDLKVLRQKGNTDTKSITSTDNSSQDKLSIDGKDEQDWKIERINMIAHLENIKRKNAQLTYDLKVLTDEKEEIVSERDAYKCKSHRLNHELLTALKVNDSHPNTVDLDALILENKYLQEMLKHCEWEMEFAQKTANKYKSMLDTKRKKGIIKLGTNNIDSIISHNQVKHLLECESDLPSRAETIADLKRLCLALLDNLNDKTLALTHQKKTNKILASKISELEQRIQLILHNGQKDENAPTNFSPSQILLNEYSFSNIDTEPTPKSPHNITEDSGTMSSESHDQISEDGNDENEESLSTNSNNSSIISSEYENPSNLSEIIASRKNKSSSVEADSLSTVPNSIIKERLEDLKDFPPELAAIVKNALDALDAKDIQETEENVLQS
ncbi:coiled-coil domain-containing protein 149 [Condylostylus longicornis]|uniref:coiled-coil domain-containing protein 149 n=1 Tax=Condylostylus longicornis TaxID=2530218 RepID=UPI00244DCB51|nr:coiled-coil domain-containing protein 149 [Condylostylus longicornis]